MTQAVIFDVDDTLVQTGGLEDALFPEAVRAVLGPVRFRPNWRDYTHVTDAGILAELARDNGLEKPFAPEIKEAFYNALQQKLRAIRCAEIPGARAMLTALRRRSDTRVGFATGGWAETAKLKLESAAIDPANEPLFSSNDAVSRTEIMHLCATALGAEKGKVIYVGDGVWDQQACDALGWHFIAVGEALRGKAAHWVRDYRGADFLDLVDVLREGRTA